jgi:gamma-glutamyltranspeptidase/glutathione hydrolase
VSVSLEEAVLRPRPHHQWMPDTVFFDRTPPEGLAEGLSQRGHKVAEKRRSAVVQAIQKTAEGWIGASDPRKGGTPAGYEETPDAVSP